MQGGRTLRACAAHFPLRFQPNVVVGARASFDGAGAAVRPVIRLAPNASKFQDPSAPMPMLDFTRHLNGHVPVVDGTNFNQLLRGVDLTIGDGNPGATAVMLPGAQGCSVQDVTINGKFELFKPQDAPHGCMLQLAAATVASPAAAAQAEGTAWFQ